MSPDVVKYCSNCSHPIQILVPDGDNRERHVCGECETIHYQNPKIITGCLPIHEDKVLLCKRAIEPRHGLWTLPAGFMENGETTAQGALREAWEEAQTNLIIDDLYTLFNLPYINQVYFFYRCRFDELAFAAGEESLEVRLFSENEIPWEELAFPVVTKTLEYFLSDRKSGNFQFRSEDIVRKPPR